MEKWYCSILMIAAFIQPISSVADHSSSKKDDLSKMGFVENDSTRFNGQPIHTETSDPSHEPLQSNPRLPGDLQPEKYDLELFTDVNGSRSKYWGKVFITVKCLKSTNEIILHQENLHIHKDDIEIKLSGSEPPSFIRVKKHKYNSVQEQYIIILWKTLEKDNNYEIKIEYSSLHNNSPDKGYLFYFYVKGQLSFQKELIAYTIMSNNAARKVFPCFDQLGMKATFKIKHSHQMTMTGLSNAEKVSTTPVSYQSLSVEDEFIETVPMEASSVSIVLSDFSSKKSTDSISNTDIRIFADEFSFEKWQSITGIATKIFQFFSDYFDVPYPFTKLDIIAIPHFTTNAVAFYGVIYISEDRALNGFNLEQTSNSAYYEIVSEICHAISQQWIGHTVTIFELTDNWIHIALNIFLQTQCVLEIEPKWERKFIEPDIMNSYWNLSELHSANIYQSFLVMGNALSYFDHMLNGKLEKAYHLIRMLHFFLGQDIFQKSINDYVEKFKYSNVNFGDLWETFTNTANKVQPHLLPNISVGEIITSWMNQEGYPLITVTWNRETKHISISQVPFNILKEKTSNESTKRCWLIPLSYTTRTESKFEINNRLREWLTCEDLHLNINMNEDDWFLLDLKVNVIGRVNYDEAIWIAIQKSLVNNEEPEVFHVFIRARLISDMFFFAEIGNLSYTIVLDAMKYLPRENQYENWTKALREFDKIRSLLLRSSVYQSFEEYVQGLLNSVIQRKDYQNLTPVEDEDLNLKIVIMESSCTYGVDACRQKSLELIKKWKSGEETLDSVPTALQRTIHCQGIKYGNRKHWDYIWNLYKQETDPSLRENYLQALSCSKSKKILKRLLEWSVDKKKFLFGDSYSVFKNLSSNRKAYKLLRTFFMHNYDRISELSTKESLSYWTAIFIKPQHSAGKSEYTHSYWVKLFNTTVEKKDLDQLLEFAKLHEIWKISSNQLYESLKRAQKNVAWLQKNKKTLENYFQNNIPRRRWIFF